MKEQWVIEAEKNAKDLAKILYKQITDEADNICIDRDWYLEKVIYYIKAESEDNND